MWILARVLLVVCFVGWHGGQIIEAVDSAPTGAITYPMFKQCDAAWGNDAMGIPGKGERSTICREGCAMSCVAMALAGLRVFVNNTQSTPKSLNTWLKASNNYECAGGDCNNLVLTAPAFPAVAHTNINTNTNTTNNANLLFRSPSTTSATK